MTKAITPETKASKKLLLVSWVILAVYSVLTFLGAINHELWLDEAQAWVILRDVPLAELPHVLNIEGHPPLWYAILYPFVKLGFPTEYVSLISWFFMALGAAVLLFKVKLPLLLKAAILASSGFIYLNSVMLRVYCLIPPLLFLILWIYPKRREHAVLYGLLIALLANTHVFICGIVGVLGIYMIYELFTEWKCAAKKENISKLIGLAIAGTGVLMLVLPLLGSVGANGAINSHMFVETPYEMLNSVLAFSIGAKNKHGFFMITALLFFKIAFVVMLVVLRHWRRAFAVEMVFLIFYYISCGILWTTMPNRAAIFMLSLAFSYCLTQYEKPVFKEYKLSEKITGRIRGLLTLLIRADKRAESIYKVILMSCFAITVPFGCSLLYNDITGCFAGSKETAEYISENLEDNAVFVDLCDGMPEISFYDSSIQIFSVDSCAINTYARWEYKYRPRETAETVLNKLSEYDNLYLIYYNTNPNVVKDNTFFESDGIREYAFCNAIAICEFDKSEIGAYYEYLDELNEK